MVTARWADSAHRFVVAPNLRGRPGVYTDVAHRGVPSPESSVRPPDRLGGARDPGDPRELDPGWLSDALPLLFRAAARMAPTSEREDLVQETLVRAWMKRSQFDPRKGTRRAWMVTILRNLAVSAERRRRRTETVHRILGGDGRLVPEPDVDSDRSLDVQNALSRLTPREKLAVDLFYFLDLSTEESAQVMGCGAGTVKSTLSSARAKLRAHFEGVDH